MDQYKWIVVNYNLPTEPSKHRVAVWRALKKLGAVNIQQSMWLMFYSPENYAILAKISQEIEQNNGTSLLMGCIFYDEKHEARVISQFNELRDDEYRELISESQKYLRELQKEITINKFTFAELEEEEEELTKLVSWHQKIKTRDIFSSSLQGRANEMVVQIQAAFESYSNLVYQKNTDLPNEHEVKENE